MSNIDIDEDVKVLKEFVELDRRIRQNKTESDYEKFCERRCVAIEHILAEREKDKNKIKELEEENISKKELNQDNTDLTTVYLKGYADAEEKYKQKVKDRIEKYKKIQEEMTMKNHNTNNINDCYKYGDEAQKAMYKREACEELLKEK